jgi:acetylglutamate kinase
MEALFAEIQTIVVTCAAAAVTALCAYAMGWLRTYLGIKESDSNESEIRRAALTEAGKLVVQGKIGDNNALVDAASKIIADLTPAVRAESYDVSDIKDMIIGAAATMFPPTGLLKR